MATTTQIRIRTNERKGLRQTFKDRLDYIKNPAKTRNGELVTCFGCDTNNTDLDYTMTRELYNSITGRELKSKEIIAYHIRQAFEPGEVTAEQAHEIGLKLIKEYLHDQHEYVLCTHIDKGHIHNHIIFNAVTLDATHKFNNEKDTSFKLRDLSDKLCLESGLGVIKNPSKSRKSYKEWNEEKQGTSWKAKIKFDIDNAISKSSTFNDFLTSMKGMGYEIKEGAHLAFRPQGKERFTRAYKLGDRYADEFIKQRIENQSTKIHKLGKDNGKYKGAYKDNRYTQKLPFIYKIAARDKIKTRNYALYQERKVHIDHIHQLAANLRFLDQEHIHSYRELLGRIDEILELKNDTVSIMKVLDSKIETSRQAARAAATMLDHAAIYVDYQNAFLKDKYRREHESSIVLYETAQRKLKELGIKMPADTARLIEVYNRANAERAAIQKSYQEQDKKIEQLRSSKKMIDSIISKEREGRIKEKEIT